MGKNEQVLAAIRGLDIAISALSIAGMTLAGYQRVKQAALEQGRPVTLEDVDRELDAAEEAVDGI